MAQLLWGNVYYKDTFAGFLREEPGGRSSFIYDESYLEAALPSVSHTLPLRSEPYIEQSGLLPFFDNLVAEGWLEEAQTRLIGKRQASRFELLLAFGMDCAGAVSIIDPEAPEVSHSLIDMDDPKELAVMAGRASLSGIQPKLTLVQEGGKLRPARIGELSTHIAKFPSSLHADLVANEYLTTLAYKALLPEDNVVDLSVGHIEGFDETALIIPRFDRDGSGGRIHFEEFNQLLNLPSKAKYDGAYKDMAGFLRETHGCVPAEIYRLYQRVLTGFLLGNTDMHLKNFAMSHTQDGLRLTPSYDQVAAALYGYKSLALKTCGSTNMPIGNLKARHIVRLGEEFGLSKPAIEMACQHFEKNIEAAQEAVNAASIGSDALKKQITNMVGKRWNAAFALIGKALSKKL